MEVHIPYVTHFWLCDKKACSIRKEAMKPMPCSILMISLFFVTFLSTLLWVFQLLADFDSRMVFHSLTSHRLAIPAVQLALCLPCLCLRSPEFVNAPIWPLPTFSLLSHYPHLCILDESRGIKMQDIAWVWILVGLGYNFTGLLKDMSCYWWGIG